MTENALKISGILTEFPENALHTPESFFPRLPRGLTEQERQMVLSHFEGLTHKYSRKNSNPHKFILVSQYLASQEEWSDLFAIFLKTPMLKKELDSPRMKGAKQEKDYTFFEFCLRYTIMFNCHKNLNTLLSIDKENRYARVRSILTNDKMVKEFPGLFDMRLYTYLKQNTRSVLTKPHFEKFIELIQKYNKKEKIAVEHHKLNQAIKPIAKKRTNVKTPQKFKI